MANNTTGNPGLMFDIKIAGIDDKEVKKMYKEKEANIQKILDSSSTLSLSIKGVDIKDLNDQLSKTKKILDQITQANNKSIIGTPLQRAKADVAYMESAEKLRLKQALATTTIASAQDRAAKSTVQLRIEEERLAQAKLRTEAAQKKQLASTQKQTAAWTANKSAMNGIPQLLSSYASILGGVRLFTQIKDITREFELQRVALRAITQDVEFADQLFERIKMSAIESPFSTKDLITYTKQLSAYRIENENLFGTMNQLADISAGLGVSMDRLILAYGQVKAASVLRGQELRQFTEAGIPLVQMLAEKFTQLRGELVSTADVFELISERAVPFEMVAELFDDMTSAGGKFYEMQKIQAESLYGVYENLRDNIEIAFNELGENNRGALMALGKGATEVVQNLTKILDVLTAIGVGFAAYKIAVALAATSTNTLTIAQLRQVAATKAQMLATASNNKMLSVSAAGTKLFTFSQVKLATATNVVTKSFWKLTAALAKSPIGLVVVGVSALIGGLIAVTKESREAKKAYEEMADSFSEKTMSVENYTAKLRDLNKIEGNNTDVAERRAKIIEQLAEVDSDYAATIKDKTEDTDFLNEAEKRYVDTLRLKLALEKELLGLGTGKIIAEHADARERENRALSELNNNYAKNMAYAKDMLNTAEISANTSKVLEEFIYGTGEYEDRLRALRLSLIGLRESGNIGFGPLQDILKSFDFSALGDWAQAAYDAKKATDELSASYASMIEETKGNKVIVDAMKSIDDAIANLGANPSDEAINQATWNLKNDIIRVYKDVFDSKGLSEELQAGFAGMFKEMTGFDFEIIAEPTAALDGWKKAFKDIGGYSEIEIENLGTYSDALDDIVKKYKENAEAIEKIKPSLDAEDPIVQKETQDKLDVYNEKQKEIYDTLEALNQLRLLESNTAGTASSDAVKSIERELSLLKAMKKEYDELIKFTGKTDALYQIRDIFNPPEGQMFDPDTYIKRLQEIMAKFAAIPDKEKTLDLKLDISGEQLDNIKEVLKSKLDEIGNEISRANKANDFFEKLLGFTGDIELSAGLSLSLHGEGIDAEGLRAKMIEQIETALADLHLDIAIPKVTVNGKVNYQGLMSFLEDVENVPEETRKTLTDILDNLVEHNEAQIENLYSTLSQYADFEQKREIITKKAQENINKILSTAYEGEDASVATKFEQDKANAVLALYRQLAKDLGELDFEIMKSSDLWVRAFGDLDMVATDTLDEMIKMFEEYQSTAAAVWDTTDIKEYISTLNKIKSERLDRSLDWFDTIGGVPETIKTSIKLHNELAVAEEWVATAKAQQAQAEEEYQKALFDLTGVQVDLNTATAEYIANLIRQQGLQKGLSEEEIQGQIAGIYKLSAAYSTSSANASNASGNYQQAAGAIKSYATSAKSAIGTIDIIFKNIHDGVQMQQQLVDLFSSSELLDKKWGASQKSQGYSLREMQSALSEFDSYTFSAWEKLKSGNITGAIADVVTSYVKLFDSGKKAKQERQVELINKLAISYDKLSAAMDDAVGSDKSDYTRQQLDNLNKQIAAQKEIIRQEKLKKNSADKNVIAQAEADIVQLEQTYKEAVDGLTEYFASTSLSSAAESFADSWLNAYVSFENTKEALKGSMDDLVKNLVAKAVLSKAVEVALAPIFSKIESMGMDGFNTQEINDLIEMAGNLVPGLDAVLTKIMDNIGITRDGETNLTGISKDIAGITEQSALALGAVGNNLVYQMVGVRGDVAAIRAIMEGTGGMGSGITLAQLQAMNAQNVAYLMDIRQNTADTAAACRDLAGSIRSVTSSRGTGSVKVLNTQLV